MDVEEGTLSERKVVPVNNSSYVVKSKNGKYLYSIADEGVAVFEIKPDGDLELINKVGIDGMRGCYLCVDDTGKYLFVQVLDRCQEAVGSLSGLIQRRKSRRRRVSRVPGRCPAAWADPFLRSAGALSVPVLPPSCG